MLLTIIELLDNIGPVN